MSVSEMVARRQGRPPIARFYREPVEDRVQTLEAGKAIMVDQDWVEVTAAYSKDTVVYKIEQFFERNKHKVATGEMPQEWTDMFKRQYAAWKDGQELPLMGTPIMGWGVISPAMQKNIINSSIRTVEDLAAVNDEGIKRLGMGGQDLKNKAKAWLEQLGDKGPLTIKMAAVERENAVLKSSVENLQRQIKEIADRQNASVGWVPPAAEITADDIFDTAPEPKSRKKG